MRESLDQNNSKYGHSLCSVLQMLFVSVSKKKKFKNGLNVDPQNPNDKSVYIFYLMWFLIIDVNETIETLSIIAKVLKCIK